MDFALIKQIYIKNLLNQIQAYAIKKIQLIFWDGRHIIY